MNCSDRLPEGCGGIQYINNKTFTPSSGYIYGNQQHWEDPFNLPDPNTNEISLVPFWRASHGNPNIFDPAFGLTPEPFLGAGYSIMGTGYFFGDATDEGIVQKIPRLQANKTYTLSFFKRLAAAGITNSIDRLYIRLMKCSDYTNPPFNPPSPSIPTINEYQEIYCERNISNTNWQQVVIQFTPNSNDYNMIWIHPEQIPGNYNLAALVFSYPELIDYTAFSAGTSPNPTSGNCNVTIGPATPNCSIANSVFTWYGPSGQIITAPPNQQIQVDASNVLNVGTWSLFMTIPSATLTNDRCSNPFRLSATVDVPNCGSQSLWPKIYEWDNGIPAGLSQNAFVTKGIGGNIYYSMTSTLVTNNSNHSGPLPGNTNSNFLLQYNSNGITTWAKSELTSNSDLFVLGNGMVRTKFNNTGPQYIFIDPISGNQTTGPSILPNDEQLLAETNTGILLSYKNSQIFVRNPNNGTVSFVNTPVLHSYYVMGLNKLIIQESEMGVIRIYNLVGNNLILENSINPGIDLYHVDNQANIYLLPMLADYSILQKYDFTTSLPAPVNIPGFNNSHIRPLKKGNIFSANYASGKCMVANNDELKLQVLDFENNQLKSIAVSGFCFFHSVAASVMYSGCSYYIDGDIVVISGWLSFIFGNTATIGNQNISNVTTSGFSNFVTKLSLQGDFNRSSQHNRSVISNDAESSFEIQLSPNPTSENLTINIQKSSRIKITNDLYKIHISNRFGKVLFERVINGTTLVQSVSNLQTGVYFVTITDEKGIKVTSSFIRR